MKKTKLYSVFFVMGWLLASCSENQPHEETVFLSPGSTDLGIIKADKTIGISFEIVNESEENLQIQSHAKSCGCTQLKLTSKILKAHDKLKVQLVFDPKDENGKFEKSAFFRLSNGEILVYKFHGVAQNKAERYNK